MSNETISIDRGISISAGEMQVFWTPTCPRIHSPIWESRYDDEAKLLAAHIRYVYALHDPDSSLGIAYIGETLHPFQRLARHIGEVTQRLVYRQSQLTKKEKWLANLLAQGAFPELYILEEIDAAERYVAEKAWCETYRKCGWTLMNSQTGPKPKHRPESIEKMKRVQKARNEALGEAGRKAVADWCRDVPLRDEHKQKLREAAKTRPPVSEVTKRKMSEAQTEAYAAGRRKSRKGQKKEQVPCPECGQLCGKGAGVAIHRKAMHGQDV